MTSRDATTVLAYCMYRMAVTHLPLPPAHQMTICRQQVMGCQMSLAVAYRMMNGTVQIMGKAATLTAHHAVGHATM